MKAPTAGAEAGWRSMGVESGRSQEILGEQGENLPGGELGTLMRWSRILRLDPSALDILEDILFWKFSNTHHSRDS